MFGFNLFSFEFHENEWFINVFSIAWGDGWTASLFYLEIEKNEFSFDIFGLATLVEYISQKLEKH